MKLASKYSGVGIKSHKHVSTHDQVIFIRLRRVINGNFKELKGFVEFYLEHLCAFIRAKKKKVTEI